MLILEKMDAYQNCVQEALTILGKENLALIIHDQSFPSIPDQDTGRGSPYSEGGIDFIRFIKRLGFNIIQLGPQGQTTRANQSTYEGTIFSKNILSIALDPLVYNRDRWAGILSDTTLHELVTSKPHYQTNRVQYHYIYDAQKKVLNEAYANFMAKKEQMESGRLSKQAQKALRNLNQAFEQFKRDNHPWLDKDALYEALCIEYGSDNWRTWQSSPLDHGMTSGDHHMIQKWMQEIRDRYQDVISFYKFCQFVVHAQHKQLRYHAKALHMKLYGDRQVGFSLRDAWHYQSLFLKEYHMGAPPSRTNPEGQPWNYPVLDPEQYFEWEGGRPGKRNRVPGTVGQLILVWLDKMFSEFDGLRIDHPHGLVCPWVYRPDHKDLYKAVQDGARLFSSPHLPDHPELKRYAIVEESQLNTDPAILRYAENWVTTLTSEQINKYGILIDVMMTSAKRHGCKASDIVFEVLSTLPFPLQKVMEKYGIGRFRVTQKADPKNPQDVYRSENARPEDWIMIGTHDTEPIWRCVEDWEKTGKIQCHADYLAERLIPDGYTRDTFSQELAAHPEKFVHAMFADIFASPAHNIMIFFADLFGMKEVYNRPGSVNKMNWTLRVPNNYQEDYLDKLSRNRALNIPYALAMAIRSKGDAFVARHRDLVRHLDELATVLKDG